MAIKDVVEELISDGLVHVEKIGTSNYYWSYPSEAVHDLKRKLQQAEESVASETNKRKKYDNDLAKVSSPLLNHPHCCLSQKKTQQNDVAVLLCLRDDAARHRLGAVHLGPLIN